MKRENKYQHKARALGFMKAILSSPLLDTKTKKQAIADVAYMLEHKQPNVTKDAPDCDRAFNWSFTPSGGSFWCEINDKGL